MKFLLLLIFICPLLADAKVTGKWLSVASVVIDDGETQLLFDAAFTRPTIGHWLGLSKFKSDKDLVQKVLAEQKLDHLKGVFGTHAHFDHSVDLPIVAAMTGATLYGSESLLRISRAYHDKRVMLATLHTVSVGKFKVSHFPRKHALILKMFDFLPGIVPADFDFDFYDYKVGESWIYLIEHPKGKILLDTSGEANLEILPKDLKVDVVIQGVANRSSDESVLEGYVLKLEPRLFIASHFDYFMLSFDPESIKPMMGVKMDELELSFKQKAPGTAFTVPVYGREIPFF